MARNRTSKNEEKMPFALALTRPNMLAPALYSRPLFPHILSQPLTAGTLLRFILLTLSIATKGAQGRLDGYIMRK